MYEINKNNTRLSIEDKVRYVRLQSNGIYVLCDESDAQGIVVNNEHIYHLAGRHALPDAETVTTHEFSGAQALQDAAEVAQAYVDLLTQEILAENGMEE